MGRKSSFLILIIQSFSLKYLIGFITGLLFGILSTSRYAFWPNSLFHSNSYAYDCTAMIANLTRIQLPNITVRSVETVVPLKLENMADFYEEYYKFYELNHVW